MKGADMKYWRMIAIAVMMITTCASGTEQVKVSLPLPSGLEKDDLSFCRLLDQAFDVETEVEELSLWVEGTMETPFLPLKMCSGKESETHHFYALRLTDTDCHNISKLIKQMADLGLWDLLKKSKEMQKLGEKVKPVHPLRFLGYIFSNPELKRRMPTVRESHFKWSKFTDGLCEGLNREADKGDINRFISGFAQVVGKPIHEVQGFVLRGDWHGLLHYLMS